MLIGLIPLIFLVYLTSSLYRQRSQKLELVRSYIEEIEQSSNVTRLIDHLQTERQYSFDYVLQKIMKEQMLGQRLKTDSLIERIRASNDSSLRHFEKYSFLVNLSVTRAAIDSNKIGADGVLHYYSSSIFRLNTLNPVMTGLYVYLKPLYSDMAAQKLLSEMITYLSIINANVYNILYTKKYFAETLLGTLPSYEVYHSYETEFLVKASPQTLEAYNKIKNGNGLKPTLNYLSKLFSSFRQDSTYNYEQWKEISTTGTNSLRNLQMDLLQNVEARMNSTYSAEKAAKTRTLVYLVLALILVCLVVAYTSYVINRLFRELKFAALRIARGESAPAFNDMPADVVGSLAASISKIDASGKKLAAAADAIGRGDFTVPVDARSSGDILGNAVAKMKVNLQQSLQQIEDSREEFKQLADFMPQIVWTAQPDGTLEYYNKRWYEYTGFDDRDESRNWISIIHPDDVQACLAAWDHSVRSGKPFEIEYRFKDSRHGGYRWFLGRAVPVFNADGAIVKWFGTCTDIHERKAISEELESLVHQRTMELERSNDDLQQFAHVASHDLKEPLRKIRVFSNRLQHELDQSMPEKGKAYVDKIQQAAQRMSAMIEGVLNYSTASESAHEFGPVDLNEIVRGVMQDLELVIQQKAATVHFNDLPTINGIRVLIYQLFYNLLNNALKFSRPDQPNRISIASKKIERPKINGSSHAEHKEFYVIEISDCGIGFDQSQADKMFQIFTRLNNREEYEGTGLGLALCKKIVSRHGGFISASGKENEGATFTILLPAS
jgi:PAS domain S-box-containing protein